MKWTLHWPATAAAALILLTFALMLRGDLQKLDWAKKLSSEGSPPPALDASSPTGYELGQRHFLANRQRGETYRWIAYTQQLTNDGFFSDPIYQHDTVPTGRPQLLPKLYAAWIASIATGIHLSTGQAFPIAIEQTALWEPVIAHAIAFLLVVAFIARRFGATAAAFAALFFALSPFISAQFLPGALSTDTAALLLATFTIALNLPSLNTKRFNPLSAILASVALSLDPIYGFPAVLIAAATGAAGLFAKRNKVQPFLTWSLIGTSLTLATWLIDQNPFSLEAGELRYNHPLYALAWLGLGLALHGLQSLRNSTPKRAAAFIQIGLGLPLISALFLAQISKGYLGWLHSSASLLRLSSLDESQVFHHAFHWLAHANIAESAFLLAVPLAAFASLIFTLRSTQPTSRDAQVALLCLGLALLLALFKIRWGIALSLLSLPVLCTLAEQLTALPKRLLPAIAAAFLFGLFAWGKSLPTSLHRPTGDDPLASSDLEALLHRHLSHWMATHNPSRPVHALAPPDLSDSLIFHGNCQTLLSTAWESYPGQVAASRALSAPEESEAQAILESREITHLLLPSWDQVLPLFVKAPQTADDTTFYDRLQRWLLPLHIRPIPYQLPASKRFETEKLSIFEIAPPQDDALSLSRLAEYFMEMRRPQPAQLAAQALAESYTQDPNSQLARALIAADAKDPAEFRQQLSALATNTQAGLVPMDWDRRVLRAIALALGKQHTLAKTEIQACLDTMNEETLYQLTALQTFQLLSLANSYKLPFPSDSLRALALRRSSEYTR